MALARSASGPGGLSINTGAANLFGSSAAQGSQPAQSSGLFAAAPSQPAKPTISLFGGSTTTTPQPQQQQQPGGLFGTSTAQPATQVPQPGSLFGSTAVSQPQQSGSLFGSTAAAQPAQTTGLFGSTANPQPQQTGGLFGSMTTGQPQQSGGPFGSTTQTQPAMAGGLFGGPAQQQPQQQSTGGLFGGSTQQQPQQGTGGLFGASLQQQPQRTGTGMFGGSTAPRMETAQGTSLFGRPATQQPGQQTAFGQSTLGPGLTMGQSTNQQTVVPGVRIDVSNIKGTTRFNDLQEELQRHIIKFDNFIQQCMGQKGQLDAFMPSHRDQLDAIPGDVRFVSRKYDGVASALGSDAQAIKGLRELVKVDAAHGQLSFKAVENLKLPVQYRSSGLWSTRQQETSESGGGEDSSDLISYFSKAGEEMEAQLKKTEQSLGEIEMHMHGVADSTMEQLQRITSSKGSAAGSDDKVAELAAVLRDFEESILKVAGVVGGAREGMTELQLGSFMGSYRSGKH